MHVTHHHSQERSTRPCCWKCSGGKYNGRNISKQLCLKLSVSTEGKEVDCQMSGLGGVCMQQRHGQCLNTDIRRIETFESWNVVMYKDGKISWTAKVSNSEVLKRVEEVWYITNTTSENTGGWVMLSSHMRCFCDTGQKEECIQCKRSRKKEAAVCRWWAVSVMEQIMNY